MPCHLAAAGTNFGIRREMLNDTINDITNAMINDAGIFFFLCMIFSFKKGKSKDCMSPWTFLMCK